MACPSADRRVAPLPTPAGIVDQLKELTTLKENGALSEDEFQAAKAKLLSPEVQPTASATPLVELSFDPVGTWKCSGFFMGGDGWTRLESHTLVITRAGADTLTVEAKDASISSCCGLCGGRGMEGYFESTSTFTIKPLTGTFEGTLCQGLPKAEFKFINENEIQTTWVSQKSLTFTRQSQDGSLMPMAPAGDMTMNRD